MAKLYFRYGAMGAAKTLNLLSVAHNYRSQGRRVFLIKPRVDTRDGEFIASRAGLKERVDFRPGMLDTIDGLGGYDCVLVDEAQFLTARQVEGLRTIATCDDVPVIAYGLKTDFRTRLFAGSQRLLELADDIEEIKTICLYCERKATQNLRCTKGEDQVEIGGDEAYAPSCFACYLERVRTEQYQVPDEITSEDRAVVRQVVLAPKPMVWTSDGARLPADVERRLGDVLEKVAGMT
jgi:thymidine kinase